MNPTKKQPLFIVSGASCAGKSTACEELFRQESDYIVLESDILWNEIHNTPEDDYCEYRRLWMRLCASISQIGKPVVLCGCAVPKQFENQPERELFSDIHYLAVVCDNAALEKRMRLGRKIADRKLIKSSLDFNEWLKRNADKTSPNITLLDNSGLTPPQTAQAIDEWIVKHTSQQRQPSRL